MTLEMLSVGVTIWQMVIKYLTQQFAYELLAILQHKACFQRTIDGQYEILECVVFDDKKCHRQTCGGCVCG